MAETRPLLRSFHEGRARTLREAMPWGPSVGAEREPKRCEILNYFSSRSEGGGQAVPRSVPTLQGRWYDPFVKDFHRRIARKTARCAGFVGITAGMLPVYAVREAMSAPEERDAVRDRWVRRWGNSLMHLFGVRVESDPLPAPGPRGRLVVMNHRSTVDIGVALKLFGGVLVSRGDLADWPVLGAAARKVGTVFVDRSASASGAAAVRVVRTLLLEGKTVTLFPEGTTFEGDEVRPFRRGAFVAALGTGAEIVPVGLAYETGSQAAFLGETFVQHLVRMAEAPPTRVYAAIGAPISIAEDAVSATLARESHAAVTALVQRARKLVDGAPST